MLVWIKYLYDIWECTQQAYKRKTCNTSTVKPERIYRAFLWKHQVEVVDVIKVNSLNTVFVTVTMALQAHEANYTGVSLKW